MKSIGVKELENGLRKDITAFLGPYGFVLVKPVEFRRQVHDVIQSIQFAPRRSKTGETCTGAGIGVSIPTITQFVFSGASNTTIGVPIHMLRPGKEYDLWCLKSEEDLPSLISSVTKDLDAYALPFLHRFQTCKSVIDALSSENPEDWFMCARDTRDAILVANLYLSKGKDVALAEGARRMTAYEARMPKYSLRLRSVIAQIENEAT